MEVDASEEILMELRSRNNRHWYMKQFNSQMIDRHSPVPLYLQVYNVLHRYINSLEAKKDVFFPTTDALAKSFGVAHNTVRQAMQMLVNENLICRIKHRGTMLSAGQFPMDPQANSHSIGLVFPASGNLVWQECIAAMQAEAGKSGLSLDVYLYNWKSVKDEQRAVRRAQKNCIGMVLYLNSIGDDHELVSALNSSSYPFVLFCLYFGDIDCNVVANDNFEATRKLTDILLKRGYNKIALFGDYAALTATRDRIDGYKAAYQNAGLAVEPDLINCSSGEFDQSKDFTDFFKRIKPDAIVAVNPKVMSFFQAQAKKAGFDIPVYVTFQTSDINKLSSGCLARAMTRTEDLGRTVIETLLHQMRHPNSVRRKSFINFLIEENPIISSFGRKRQHIRGINAKIN